MVAKCGHCGAFGTKIVEIEPYGGAYKQSAICCNACNSILGVRGYYDSGALVKEQEQEIKRLRSDVAQLDHQMRQVLGALNELLQRR